MTGTLQVPSDLSRLRAAAASAAAALLVGMAISGCAVSTPGASAAPAPEEPTAVNASAGPRIVLRFDAEVVTATLADTATARQFAAQLPLKLDLRDPMGQAKSGRLPSPIDDSGAETIVDPDAGGIYYVPDREMIAIFHTDLDQTVPAPGLIRLGTIDGDGNSGTDSGDGGTDAIAGAGNRMLVLIDAADRTGF